MAGDRAPTVSVVTVNYNGRRYLEPLLPSLLASDLPRDRFEVIVVDNGSSDGSAAWMREAFPAVRVVETGRNRGFAGGCNAGIAASKAPWVALVNNDAVADPAWLRSLVEVGELDPRIGMVGSKILFLTPFLDLRIEGATFLPTEFGVPDGRPLLVRLHGARIEGCRYDKLLFREGCYPEEVYGALRFRWLAGTASMAVPIEDRSAPATLVLTLGGAPWLSRDVVVRVGGEAVAELRVEPGEHTFQVALPAAVVARAAFVINNAGSYLGPDGRFGDRGIFEFDSGQYDRVEEMEALCGASVLLRRAMLERIGLLDERYFMYFEDADLSWRARRGGYRLVYTPRSVVHHVHAGSSGEWSAEFTYFVQRNHVMWLVEHGEPWVATRAVAGAYRRGARALASWAGFPAPVSPIDWRVARGLTVRLPRLLFDRWRAGAPAAPSTEPLVLPGCNLCGHAGPFGNTDHTEAGACPGCGAVTRDRMLFAAFLAREPGMPARLRACVPSSRRVVECSPRLGAAYREEMRRRFAYVAIDFDEQLHAGDRREDLQALSLPSGSVDAFLCSHVLEHVERETDALREIKRVLAPGGRLFLQVPVKRARTVVPSEPTYHADHTLVFREFGLIDLVETIRAAGYQLEIAVLPRLLEAMENPEAPWVTRLRQDDCTFADKFGPRAETLRALEPHLVPVAPPAVVAAASIGAVSYQEVFVCTRAAST